jgi:hypothetical protein
MSFAAEEFPAMSRVKQNRRPTSATRVSETRTIRYELNFLHLSIPGDRRPFQRVRNQLKTFLQFYGLSFEDFVT